MYLKVLYPTILQTNGAPSSVLDSVGTLMIDFIELYIGNLLIERIYGEYIDMKLDLEIPTGKQGALKGLIGKSPTSRTYSLPGSTYTIPLQFSCLKSGLPLFAFKESVYFRISFRPSTTFMYDTALQTSILYTLPVTAYLHVEYTYLSDAEI